MAAIRAPTVKPAYQIACRTLDCGHASWVAVRPHVGFHKGSAAKPHGILDCRFKRGCISNILLEQKVRSGLLVATPHDD